MGKAIVSKSFQYGKYTAVMSLHNDGDGGLYWAYDVFHYDDIQDLIAGVYVGDEGHAIEEIIHDIKSLEARNA